MNLEKGTAVGTALRAFRHFIDRQRFYQLKFASGEQAIVFVAGMPAPFVEVFRLALGGFLPCQMVWEYSPMRAGGYSDYVHKLKAIFSPTAGESDDSVHCIRETLLACESIEDARMLLLQRERLANSATADDFASKAHSAASDDGWELGIFSAHRDPSAERPKPAISQGNEERRSGTGAQYVAGGLNRNKFSAFPKRYSIRTDGASRVLACVEAPTLRIRAERGLTISAKQARKSPPGTIFLDGAAQGEPFLDVQKQLYNLDHQKGCIRSLATCEQAMILVRKGLGLRERDWVVLANDADLDTVLALWVLLNHIRFGDHAKTRAKITPLLRLAGVIDAHGQEAQDLTALPPELLHSTSAMLKQLQKQESVLKDYGRWSEADLLEYIADRLHAVDELIYAPEDFEGFHEVDELAQAQIGNGSVAVVCRSSAGIDAVQRQLQKIYGQRLGILIFQDAPSTYSMRRVDPSLPATLTYAHERLNLLDPAVKSNSENRWSGSDEMSSSPGKTGTDLTPAQIIEAVREAFWAPNLFDVVSAVPRAVFLAGAALLPALALIFVGNLLHDRGFIAADTVLLSVVVLAAAAGFLFMTNARRIPGLYGGRLPAGFAWLNALPAALAGAFAGGIWAPGSLAYRIGPDHLAQFTGATALLLPLAAELLFRGVILGHLAAHLPIRKSGGPWWRSWPTLISTALYAAASLLLFATISRGEIQITQSLLVIGGAVIFGIASGTARERSESVLASVLFHWVCAVALLLGGRLLV
jgi:hypothetical protein